MKNVTITVEEPVLQWARITAAKRNSSVSRMVGEMLAEKMCQEFAWDGQPLQEGDCVAILDGRVIAVARKPDEAIASLRKADPNPRRGMVIEISRPTLDVIR